MAGPRGAPLIFIHIPKGWHSPRPRGTIDVSRGLQSTVGFTKQSASRSDASGGFAAIARRGGIRVSDMPIPLKRRYATRPIFRSIRGLKPTANVSCPAGTREEGGASAQALPGVDVYEAQGWTPGLRACAFRGWGGLRGWGVETGGLRSIGWFGGLRRCRCRTARSDRPLPGSAVVGPTGRRWLPCRLGSKALQQNLWVNSGSGKSPS